MSFAQELIENSQDIWQYFFTHPFITGMIDGTLKTEKFKNYIIQDTLYIYEYSKVYAYAFIKTRDIDLMRKFYINMNMVNSGEGLMHIEYLEKLGMTEAQALAVKMKTTNRNYVNSMLRTAATGTVADAYIAAAPCCLTYMTIGKYCLERAKSNGTYEDNFYKRWIDEYSSEICDEIYKDCLKTIDKLTEGASEEDKKRYLDIFRESSIHEVNFWDMGFYDL